MDKKEFKEKSIMTTLFQGNSVAYIICFIASIVELWYTLTILDVIEVNFMMGIITFLNIALLFALFTAAVKVKIYSEKWANFILLISLYIFVRAFYLIPFIVKPYDRKLEVIVLNVILGILLAISGVLTLSIINKRNPYLDLRKKN
jgi:hypothetical protein